MAIKQEGDRMVYDNIKFVLNTSGEAGIICVYKTATSGSSGNGESDLNEVLVPNPSASGSGTLSGLVAAGLLVNQVVSIDESRYQLNEHKNEVRVGSPVHLLKKGGLFTNQVSGTPKLGDTAYVTYDGKVAPTATHPNTPSVGVFGGVKDANGYVMLYLDIK